jgi:hypothetical protein
MSSEEQFTKIHNLLQALTESQVKAELRQTQTDKEMAELRQLNKASNERLDRHIEFVATEFANADRALAESAKQIARTAAAQEVTQHQLQEFIRDVDDRFGKLERKNP